MFYENILFSSATIKKITMRKFSFNGGNAISNENQVLVSFIKELPTIILVAGLILFIMILTYVAWSLLKKESNYDWSKYNIDKNDNVSSMINEILKQTNNFYIDNRKQMHIIFICAIVFSFIGLSTLIISIFLVRENIISISSAILNTTGGSLFWIYGKSYKQNKYYFDRRSRLERLLIALQISNGLDKKNKNINKIIASLIDDDLDNTLVEYIEKEKSKNKNMKYYTHEEMLEKVYGSKK